MAMNSVIKIPRIDCLGVFRNFTWPEGLPEFSRYNLIYGWNGSGKTLLSRVFADLQKGSPPNCKDIRIKLSTGEAVCGNDFPDASSNMMIRVFNRDFMQETVYETKNLIRPIFVLGETAKAKQQELEAISDAIDIKRKDIQHKEQESNTTQRRLEEICTEGALKVSTILQIPGRQYERGHFRRDIQTIIEGGDYLINILNDEEAIRLTSIIQSEPRTAINTIDFSFSSHEYIFEIAREICGTSVASTIIEALREHTDINLWVEEGLRLHKVHNSRTCLFCNQELPSDRIQQLDAHFSKEYEDLVTKITDLIANVRNILESARSSSYPDPELLYPDLRERYVEALNQLNDMRTSFIQKLVELIEILERKRGNPFLDLGDTVPQFSIGDEPIENINDIIAGHNNRVENHQEEVDATKAKLKKHIISTRVEEYRRLENEQEALEEETNRLGIEIQELQARNRELERDLREHRRPAEELNQELASYLGHDELQFEIEETGYRIVRNGETAEALSEGEKTAIAFLYFLKSLDDKDFDLSNGIVVIDDPVSSLDSASLYYAFGFMKDRINDAGQVFVLTHNFLFFRQVKDWFKYHNKKNKDSAKFYMLEVKRDEELRNSCLLKLDPLLYDYESEYHYLFSKVYRASNTEDESGLEQYYYLPNIIRRLLEAFLEFKVPGKGGLYERLGGIDSNAARRERIRRFCETHSHSGVIDAPEQDPVILGEASSIARDVMELFEMNDLKHYKGMLELIGA